MVAAGSIVLQDVPPFVTASGYPAIPHGTNSEGLRRRGFAASDITAIRRAYKTLYRSKLSFDEARAAIAAEAGTVPALGIMVKFLETPGRGIIR
jgi:UDP-N-acetylglucosamine acyltransferase